MNKKGKWAYYVVQRGGSSGELFLIGYNTLAAAKCFRKSCAEAAYKTSEPVRVSRELADQPRFDEFMFNFVDKIGELLSP